MGWSAADRMQALHTGVTSTGRKLNPDFMPWESFGKFSDEELKGLRMYLQSLPATPTATQ